MRIQSWAVAVGVFLALLLPAGQAQAQYRNKSLAFDFSYMGIIKPSITDVNGLPLDMGHRGDRLTRGLRLGGEGAFKLHRDHWWFATRLNLMSFMFAKPAGASLNEQAELAGAQELGFNLGLEGMLGVRYYFLTDRIRPYLQASLGYMHIFSFGSGSSATCTLGSGLCSEGGSYGDEFMPRRNFLTIHAAPSIEFVLARDVALHVILDYTRWVAFRGRGNNVFTGGLGIVLFG